MVGNGATTERIRDQGSWLPPWLNDVREVPIDPERSPKGSPPERYRVRQHADGKVLTCVEAPTIKVRIEQGHSITATAARSAAPGSIFLDGAAQGEPFLDPKREIYNLDHHEGCVRAFTMATCEQAMVLLRKGLDLRKRDWTVYANDPDLDTVLAIWVLVNHIRLHESHEARRRVMPLLRLQGAIDAQGLELQDLCGFSDDQLAEMQDWIARLREREVSIKARRRWRDLDLLDYTAEVLHAVDALVYPPAQLAGVEEVEELARVQIASGSIAVVCRSRTGIYEVERHLRRLHGRRLGVIALQKDEATYAIRQVDPYLPATLEDVYTHLNLVDAAVPGPRSVNRWGGSAEIGGSPRGSGTRVTPDQIALACQQAFATRTLGQRLLRIAGAVTRNAGLMLAALSWTVFLALLAGGVGIPGEPVPTPTAEFPALLILLGSGVLLWRGRRTRGLYGLKRPTGLLWWLLLPVALGGALSGGVWIPAGPLPEPGRLVPSWTGVAALFVLPVAAEIVFRGLLLGGLASAFPMRRLGARFLFSWPAFLSAALYALWGVVLAHPSVGLIQSAPSPAIAGPIVVPAHLGAFAFGVAAGLAREQSASIVIPILFHCLSAAAVIAAAGWLG
jgi:membrane protease YdiL (CAAX protease family)